MSQQNGSNRRTPEESNRDSRHVTLPEVGVAGQEKLKAARVLSIGAGGLGVYIFRGVAVVDDRLILAGALPAALLALAADGLLGLVERKFAWR